MFEYHRVSTGPWQWCDVITIPLFAETSHKPNSVSVAVSSPMTNHLKRSEIVITMYWPSFIKSSHCQRLYINHIYKCRSIVPNYCKWWVDVSGNKYPSTSIIKIIWYQSISINYDQSSNIQTIYYDVFCFLYVRTGYTSISTYINQYQSSVSISILYHY